MCVQWLWYEGWLDTDASHVLPEVVLASITLRRGVCWAITLRRGCVLGHLEPTRGVRWDSPLLCGSCHAFSREVCSPVVE